ncbi:hypothetical protein [Actinomadura parmotrematis]|uniref:DUF4190 domain-containing protein n=1 Tax=Actinomadura parmotrematis TaxID=2864039 RepID=A0ABS7FWL8_9ACTN|nr:hypothetical protein [Actinomadura parmotrematis]MBW8484711.1 hypothetical protein [Actinomadura parmotrematis]
MPLLLWPFGLEMALDRAWMPRPPSLPLVVGVAVVCGVACLGGGAASAVRGRRAFGAGLVLGWGTAAVVSSGWLVGLAPVLYDPAAMYRPYVDVFSRMDAATASRRAEAELGAVIGPQRTPAPVVARSRVGGCWRYDKARRSLVEPPGSGVLLYRTVLPAPPGHGQDEVERIAVRLQDGRRPTGRDYETAFRTEDGFVVQLLAAGDDGGVTVTVRSPCLQHLRHLQDVPGAAPPRAAPPPPDRPVTIR